MSHHRPGRLTAVLTSLPVLALVFALACGAAATPTPDLAAGPTPVGPADGPTPTATAQPTPALAPSDVGTSGHLRIALRNVPPTADPHDYSAVLWMGWHTRINEGLTNRALDGTLEPALATGWEFDDDGLGITWNLRQGVRFHNGTDFTAEDVVWSLERLREHPGVFVYTSFWVKATEISIIDDHILRMELSHPFFEAPHWGDVFIPIVSKQHNQQMASHFQDMRNNNVGTGPFKLVSIMPREELVFEANTDYWGQVPYVQRFTTTGVIEASTREAMLRTGQVDIVELIPAHRVEAVSNFPDVQVDIIPALETQLLRAVTAHGGPMADRRVRLALWHALDIDLMIETLWRGMATRPVDMIAPGFPGHNPDIDTPRYDPERARQLLEEAGYGEGLQLRGIYAPTFSVVADEATEAIRQMLLEVGVDLRWERVEPAVTDELTPQKFPGYDLVPSVSRNIGYYPIRDLWQWFHSTNAPSTHNNPEWDQIIEDASRATTEEEYLQQIIAAYETLLVEEAGNIPLFHPLYTLGWRTDRIAEFPHTEGWSVYPRNMHHIVPK